MHGAKLPNTYIVQTVFENVWEKTAREGAEKKADDDDDDDDVWIQGTKCSREELSAHIHRMYHVRT